MWGGGEFHVVDKLLGGGLATGDKRHGNGVERSADICHEGAVGHNHCLWRHGLRFLIFERKHRKDFASPGREILSINTGIGRERNNRTFPSVGDVADSAGDIHCHGDAVAGKAEALSALKGCDSLRTISPLATRAPSLLIMTLGSFPTASSCPSDR